jgi:uncharacterized protein YqfB (UPF0267 family)
MMFTRMENPANSSQKNITVSNSESNFHSTNNHNVTRNTSQKQLGIGQYNSGGAKNMVISKRMDEIEEEEEQDKQRLAEIGNKPGDDAPRFLHPYYIIGEEESKQGEDSAPLPKKDEYISNINRQ